jgi:hypothetical protein
MKIGGAGGWLAGVMTLVFSFGSWKVSTTIHHSMLIHKKVI